MVVNARYRRAVDSQPLPLNPTAYLHTTDKNDASCWDYSLILFHPLDYIPTPITTPPHPYPFKKRSI